MTVTTPTVTPGCRGSLTFTKGPHSLVYDGMGNYGQTVFETLATPVQNNGYMHTVIYTYTKGAWIVQPYFQYSKVPTNPSVGVVLGASTTGGALYVSHAFKNGFALPGRFEYIIKLGGTTVIDESTVPAVNLLGFGPGSSATSFTVTPTYQKGGFYFRADFAVVHATNYITGDVFGPLGNDATSSAPLASSASSSATTLSRNDRYEALAPQGASAPILTKDRTFGAVIAHPAIIAAIAAFFSRKCSRNTLSLGSLFCPHGRTIDSEHCNDTGTGQ